MCFYQICRIMDRVGLVRTVAVLDYVGGHFEYRLERLIFSLVENTLFPPT